MLNWEHLDLATLEAQIERAIKVRDIWQAEYDRIKRQMDILKAEARRPDGNVSNPVIGDYGRHLQVINQSGLLRVKELIEANQKALADRRALLDALDEADAVKEELELLLNENPELRGMLDEPSFPVATGFSTDSMVKQQKAQVGQLRKALATVDQQLVGATEAYKTAGGKGRAIAGHYVAHLKKIQRGLKDQIKALDPTAKQLEDDVKKAQLSVIALRTTLERAHDTIEAADVLLEESRQEAAQKTKWWKRFLPA